MATPTSLFYSCFRNNLFLPRNKLILLATSSFLLKKWAFSSRSFYLSQLDFKSRKDLDGSRKAHKDSDSDSDSDKEDNEISGKGTEVKNSVVTSMRVDLLLKVGLGVARNKVEDAFYESKLRVNSKKIFKKSHQVRVGDEVDLVKGVSPANPAFITVGRIEVLSAKPREETGDIIVKLRRSKALVIENYPDGDPWKHSES